MHQTVFLHVAVEVTYVPDSVGDKSLLYSIVLQRD